MDLIFSLPEIQDAAKKVLNATSGHKVFSFYGEMGAGKTTFIHALCEAMGVKDNIASPTFSIINEYTTGDGQVIFHIDLYRLKDEEDAINAGVEDCLYSGNYCFVEWPEKAAGIFPGDTKFLAISLIDENTRLLIF